jgi:CheY-like chemotaxis protein
MTSTSVQARRSARDALVDGRGNTPRDGKVVLVVDDHHDTALFLTELLEFCGATVRTASSAMHARLHLQRRGPLFSLVICDLQMPRETGTNFMRWLRAQPYDNATVPADFLGAGDVRTFDAFFVKPIDARTSFVPSRRSCRFREC